MALLGVGGGTLLDRRLPKGNAFPAFHLVHYLKQIMAIWSAD